MALTREQFDQLRAKGLSVEQIVKFDSGYTPSSAIQPSNSLGAQLSNRIQDVKSAGSKALEGSLAGNDLEAGARLALRTGGAIAGGIGDIIFQGIKAITPQPVEDTVSGAFNKVASTVPAQIIISKVSAWAEKNPEAAKDLENVLDIASLIPAGKGARLAGDAADLATKGATDAIKGAGKAAGTSLSTLGAVSEKTGKRLTSILYPPNESQIARITSYKADNPFFSRISQSAKGIDNSPITPADVALKYNIVGVSRTENAAKADRIRKQLWKNQVNPVLSGITEKVSKKELFSKIDSVISKTPELSERNALKTAFEAVKADYNNISSFSYKQLDTIKSSMANKLPSKVWKGEDISGAVNNVRKIFSDEARTIVRNKLPDNVKTIYDEYGSLKEIIKVGNKAYKQGSFGSGWLGMSGEALRMIGTPISTIGGKALDLTGKGLKKIGNTVQKSADNFKLKAGLSIEDVSRNKLPSTINSTNNTLIQEARKYKSAEEFVKAQGTPVYHGTNKSFTQFDKTKIGSQQGFDESGFFFTTDLEKAKRYSGDYVQKSKFTLTPEERVINENLKAVEAYINKGEAKQLISTLQEAYNKGIISKPPKTDFVRPESFFDNNRELIKELSRKTDINVLKMTAEGETQYLVLKPEQIKTKSQLTDIWNKANDVSKKRLTTPLKSAKIGDMDKNVINMLKLKADDNGKMPSIVSIHELLNKYNIKHQFSDSQNIIEKRAGNKTYITSRKDGKSGKKIVVDYKGDKIILDTSDPYYSVNSWQYAKSILRLIGVLK